MRLTRGSSGNLVQGNTIGLDATGTRALAGGSNNSRDGILIDNAPGNLVGGTAPGAGNVVSGNGSTGIQITGASAHDTTAP